MDDYKSPDYISFGNVARRRLNEQCQYARHWLKDPVLGTGVRWLGDFENYHSLKIHRDDVEVFVARVSDNLRATGVWR